MSQLIRTNLNSVLLGDELGQIKLVQLNLNHNNSHDRMQDFRKHLEKSDEHHSDSPCGESHREGDNVREVCSAASLGRPRNNNHRHRIVKIIDDCLQKEPASSRAITTIRPIEGMQENYLDSTEKPNNLFLITNKVGQIFLCDTDVVRRRVKFCSDHDVKLSEDVHKLQQIDSDDDYNDHWADKFSAPILSPIYYNMNNKIPVCGSQPINQTNILVIYQNGDIQQVSIGQDILQNSLKIKRKAVRMLGLGYNSDAQVVHWRIDGSTGICYFDSDAAHLNENDPLIDIVLSSPTHKLSKKRTGRSEHNLYNKSPCVKSRKYNELDRLVPTQVINMMTSRADCHKLSSRPCKWSSITSLNLIYRKLALYDLVGTANIDRSRTAAKICVTSYKLNDNRLAVGGQKYALRVYDVSTQQAIYNCISGSGKNPLACPSRGEPLMIGDLDWLGGNKTTLRSPPMLATCSGVDSIVKVFDLRSHKPTFNIDLTHYTENRWQPYENQPRGCVFTQVCASGAPYSTAVPSQQLALGATNGQLHIIDLRFTSRTHRIFGRLAGFCGGSVREMRFVSESFELSKLISCATDRFVRVHKIQTSFTSVISQKLATEVFLGTRPTCIQPVCDEITQHQNHSDLMLSRYGSVSHLSSSDSDGWSLP